MKIAVRYDNYTNRYHGAAKCRISCLRLDSRPQTVASVLQRDKMLISKCVYR